MNHDKENVDPDGLTGILKHDENKTMPILYNNRLAPLTKVNRRVSFAPEVTLHKIDFIPHQSRRETIGHGPSPLQGQELVQKLPEKTVAEIGQPILADSSDEEIEQTVENNADDINSANDSDSDMELTEPMKPIKVDEMELTDSFTRVKLNELFPQYKPSSDSSPSKVKVNTVVEDEMDFTESLPKIKIQSIINEDSAKQDETMEMTQPLSKINNALSTINENDESDMEITKPLSKISPHLVESSESRLNQEQNVDHPNPSDSQDHMEFTQTLSTITANEPKVQDTQSQEMEITQPLSTIRTTDTTTGREIAESETTEKGTTETETENENENEPELETVMEPSPTLQQNVQTDSIQLSTEQAIEIADLKPSELPNVDKSNTPDKGLKESPTEADEEMELTQPASSIPKSNRTSIDSREITPQFPDIQIPIPEELNKKRLSDYEDLQLHKQPKIVNAFDSETLSVPLADVSNDSIQLDDHDEELYKDYKNVSLSQFLYDIGITFYDDLEIDKLERFSLSNEIKDFTFDDYVRGNNNVLIYSLFKFMNKELSKNITDGKNLYQELNTSVLDNNPKLFKEFYTSDENDKILIKLDFLLIKDLSRLETKKLWYNWRMQLIENLMIQLNAKHEYLVQDEMIIANTLKELKQKHRNHVNKFEELKHRLRKKLEFKTSYDNYSSADMNNIKQELSELRDNIINTKTSITKKLDQISDVNEQIGEVDRTVEGLQNEIDTLEKIIQDSKNYELKEIKILNFNFKLLQELTAIKYLQKDQESIYFKYKDFKIEINAVQLNFQVSVLNNNFRNKWLATYVIRLSKEMQTSPEFSQLPFLNKCIQLKTMVNNFMALDGDVFRLSIKYPIVNQPLTVVNDRNEDSIKFVSKYFNKNYKINLQFTIKLKDLISYPPKTMVKGELIKTNSGFTDKLTDDKLAHDYIHDCHLPNKLFQNLEMLI